MYHISVGETIKYDVNSKPLIEVKSRDIHLNENNLLGLSVRIENKSDELLEDFKIKYFLTTEKFKAPVLDNWYSSFATVSLEKINDEYYAVVFDYSGKQLVGNSILPIDPDNVVGIHYPDWSIMDKANDYSNLPSIDLMANPRVVVYDKFGQVIYGNEPSNPVSRDSVQRVIVLSRERKLNESNYSAPEIYIKNIGDDLSDFEIHYYFTTEGALPILEDWSSVNSEVKLVSLGNDEYKVIMEYKGYTLPAQSTASYLTLSYFGLRYPDWRQWDKSNDVSNSLTENFIENKKIEVYNNEGVKIW